MSAINPNQADTMIPENHHLTSATAKGYPVPIYDDGEPGTLFVFRNTSGIVGIVRAASWEAAWEIAEDEFQPEASETVEELRAEYGFHREHVRQPDGTWRTVETPDPEAWTENALFQEAFGFRPNGPRAGKRADGTPLDPIGHGIYAKDLNGEALDYLTPALAESLEISLVTEPW